LEIPASFDPLIWLVGIVGGIMIVTLSGWLATRKLIQRPPLRILAAD
jgi:putative ABC transport system permease protein